MKNLSLADIINVSGGNDDESTNVKIGDNVTEALDEIGETIDDLLDKIHPEHSNEKK